MEAAGTERRRSHDPFADEIRAALNSISEDVKATKADVATIKARQERMEKEQLIQSLKLWGAEADQAESNQGRIPRIEAKQINDDKRLKQIERFRWFLVGGSVAAAWIAEQAVEFFKH